MKGNENYFLIRTFDLISQSLMIFIFIYLYSPFIKRLKIKKHELTHETFSVLDKTKSTPNSSIIIDDVKNSKNNKDNLFKYQIKKVDSTSPSKQQGISILTTIHNGRSRSPSLHGIPIPQVQNKFNNTGILGLDQNVCSNSESL